MLHLSALDAEDLPALSVQMQDAVARFGDMVWAPKRRQFALLANRFAWDAMPDKQRRRTGLRFNHVTSVKRTGPEALAKDSILSILALTFEPETKKGLAGILTLHCSGGHSIALSVECVDVQLDDLGPAWATSHEPQHGG